MIIYELKQIGYDHSALGCHQCCISNENQQDYQMGNEEDTKSEHATLTDGTIPTLNTVIGDSFKQSDWSSTTKQEMKSNEKSSRDIKQSMATMIESDQKDTNMRKYSQFKQNLTNEEKTDLVRSRHVRQTELS